MFNVACIHRQNASFMGPEIQVLVDFTLLDIHKKSILKNILGGMRTVISGLFHCMNLISFLGMITFYQFCTNMLMCVR